MESFNFGAFDTNLGARIAAIPQEAQKQQTANMLQAMQMQGVMNQNELAQSQMRTAKRAEEGQTLLGKAYGGLDFSGAGEGGVPGQSPFAAMKSQVIKSLTASNRPDLIPGELAKLTEMEHKETVNRELIGKINQQKTVAQISEADRYRKALVNVSNYDSAAYWLRHQYDNAVLKDIISIVPFETALAEIPKDPVGLADWKNKNALGLEKYIEQNKPSITTQNTGTTTGLLSTPGLGGAATVVPGSQATIQISPNTTATLKQQQDHFNSLSAFQKRQLADAGWTFDSDRGLAVNARRGISQPISTLMTPVSGGGAPAVGGATAPNIAPGGGVPGQRQAPAGQPVAGVLGPKPEKPIWNSEAQGFIYPPSQDNPAGKFVAVQGMEGKPLTEVQAKSALFGSAMQQANTVITEIGKKGTFTSAIVPGLLEGIVKLAPLGIGDAAANAIESAFRTDPTGLIGPNENQQRLAQAQLGFAIGYLRSTSGAAFGAQEVANTIKEYFPLQGESKIVIEQKSASRERAIQGMRLAAGKSGSDFINKYVPKVNTETSPSNLSEPPPGAVRPRGSR